VLQTVEILRKLPGVRKISCSAWNDKEHFAEALPKGMIMSSKPSPALLATSPFEEAVRNDLRATIAAARQYGHPPEFLQKDISTVRYDPRRLWRWGQIAIEECQNA